MWLITFATYRRRPVFENPDLLVVCADAIREVSERNGYRVKALVVMPDHVHVVLDSAESGHESPKVLNNLKGVASRRVFQACPSLKLDLHSEHLWADEYQAKPLPDGRAVQRACRYVEDNPEGAGLAAQRYSWIGPPGPAR